MYANNTINGFYSPTLQDLDFSCSQTQVEDDPWWHVNLDRQYPVLEIRIGTNTSNSMIFLGCVNTVHMGNILYKYGWNRGSDNKLMNLYLRYVCVSGARQNMFNETHLVQNVVYI